MEARTIESLNERIMEFSRDGWIVDENLIVTYHDGKVSYIQRLAYKRTWLEYIREKICIG